METDRCIVTDKDIVNLLKTEQIHSWERLLERTGYENMEHLRRRVRRMEDRKLIYIISNDPLRYRFSPARNRKDIEYQEKSLEWSRKRKKILNEAREKLRSMGGL